MSSRADWNVRVEMDVLDILIPERGNTAIIGMKGDSEEVKVSTAPHCYIG
jgi:hypothetical protein